jgi:hypothetical protein
VKRFALCSVLVLVLVTSTGCGSLLGALAGPAPAGTVDTVESRDTRAAARLDALAERVDGITQAAKTAAAVGVAVPGPVGVGLGEAAGIAGLISMLISYGLHATSEAIKKRYDGKAKS